ncbi:MAG: hypothetical protein ACJAW8_001239 [Oleispira sp.]|jgi:hypothetical protein
MGVLVVYPSLAEHKREATQYSAIVSASSDRDNSLAFTEKLDIIMVISKTLLIFKRTSKISNTQFLIKHNIACKHNACQQWRVKRVQPACWRIG